MKILLIDNQASALDWIMRCLRNHHEVKWYVPPDKKTDEVGKGICERIDNPDEWYRWADLIMFSDNTKWLDRAEKWRKEGWPVICASPDAAKWELDRGTGQDILKKKGVVVPDFKVFHDYDSAISFVKKNMKRYVSKPDNSPDKALSYCAKSPADMVYMLERWKKNNKLKGSFLLQEFIPGIEMAVGAWFGPGGFNRGWCENWEFKKLMNDDLGVATGEQGTVLRYVAKSKLADKVLKPVEEALAKLNYVGYIDVNCIIDEHGTPLPLEFTMRPGWPTFNIQQALNKGDSAEWLLDLAEGKDSRNWEMDTIATGVVMSIPDYPYSHITRKEVQGIPLYGMTPLIARSVHPCEMQLGEAPVESDGKIINEPCLVTAGDYVLVASGKGKTITESKKAAYKIVKSLSLPNSPMYRTDIGNRLKKQLPELQKMGFAAEMSFL